MRVLGGWGGLSNIQESVCGLFKSSLWLSARLGPPLCVWSCTWRQIKLHKKVPSPRFYAPGMLFLWKIPYHWPRFLNKVWSSHTKEPVMLIQGPNCSLRSDLHGMQHSNYHRKCSLHMEAHCEIVLWKWGGSNMGYIHTLTSAAVVFISPFYITTKRCAPFESLAVFCLFFSFFSSHMNFAMLVLIGHYFFFLNSCFFLAEKWLCHPVAVVPKVLFPISAWGEKC